MTTHVDDFAERLRELKDRSGRSYGMLAGRLHVSTSTLHRYCNGAAVPADYAPVERFARVCGATPEELVDLHRRWLLADAERRREPAGRSSSKAAPEDSPELSSAEVEGSAAAEAGVNAEVEVAAEPGAGQPQAEPVTVPVPPAVPAAAAAPAAPVAEPAPQWGGEPQAALGLPESRPRRGRALLAAAVAAIAVVIPVTLHSVDGKADAASSVTLPTGSAAAGPAGTSSASGSPSASRSSASASSPSSASAASSPSSGAGTGAASASSSAPGQALGAGTNAPFQVSVLSDNWDTECDQWFLASQQPGKVPPPPSLEEAGQWAAALGALPAGHLRLQITAQGTSAQSVVLNNLYVHVVSARPAPKGIGYTTGSGCGGGLTPASFAVDLDKANPGPRSVPGYEGANQTPAVNFPFQTSASDPQVLDVDAHTAGQDVSWYLELRWTYDGRSGLLKVDDNGRPFRTVGLAGDPTYFYDGANWAAVAPPS